MPLALPVPSSVVVMKTLAKPVPHIANADDTIGCPREALDSNNEARHLTYVTIDYQAVLSWSHL